MKEQESYFDEWYKKEYGEKSLKELKNELYWEEIEEEYDPDNMRAKELQDRIDQINTKRIRHNEN